MTCKEIGGGGIRPLLSFLFGLILALLIIAPNVPYSLPVMQENFVWCYLAVTAAFFGVLICWHLTPVLGLLSIYLFANCFFSQGPYLSFNAYILVVFALWLFVLLQHADFKIVIRFLEAAFWLQVILTAFQLMGRDRLLNFADAGNPLFFGTVMQYMRFASLLAVLAPFLIIKNRWYLVPIVILCVISKSSTFALSLTAGLGTYFFLCKKTGRIWIIAAVMLAAVTYAAYDWASFRGAIIPSNGGRLISWAVIFKTWFTDTALASPPPFTGPFNLQWFLIGHGLDTFLTLFPIYKHDRNPFPQAHNCWLQFLWEIGLVGFTLVVLYCAFLVFRLYRARRHDLLAGCVTQATVMFFSFPTRMTQTMFLLVAWCAYCEAELLNALSYRTVHETPSGRRVPRR